MSSLEPSFISSMSDKFVELIKQVDNEYFPKVKMTFFFKSNKGNKIK